MNKLLSASSFCIYLLFCCTGCVTYTTLQGAKTLEPGQSLFGAGSAIPVAETGIAFMPEVNARAGIVRKFDLGIKYAIPSLFFLDGKIQIIDDPITVSADLGWSYFSYSGDLGKSEGKSTGWYPMIIMGQEHWYVAVKEVYFATEGKFEFFGLHEFQGSGWITTNVVVGFVAGKKVRFLPELNIIVPRNGKLLLVPPLDCNLFSKVGAMRTA